MEEKEEFDLFGFLAKQRLAFGYIAAAAFILFAAPTKASVLIGIVFSIIGETIRTVSAGIIMKNKILTTCGPYSYVRNPLYLGSFLIGVGVCIMGNVFIFTLLFIPLYLLIYTQKIKSEEANLRGIFKEKFDEYVMNVPGLLPRFTPWKREKIKFELRLIKVHKEYQAWIGIYAVTLIMLLKT